MNGEYQARLEPSPHLEQGAAHFAYSGIVALVFMAAIPAGLSLLQQAALGLSTRSPAISRQNAAATAFALGNQPPKPALAKNSDGVGGAKEDVLALCSGLSGANPHARLNCTPLVSTIQR
jgi:type IV secretory pathway TrbL component